ncbi:MAG TPA: O-antigen ligase family protein, partial [Chthonomonadaceae bacterium]|nr:O-antigen ligase family protein [Chthonomonadaceae bacterium]
MNATSNWLAPVLRNRMVMFILAMAVLVPLAFAPVSAHNPALGAVLLEGCAIVLLAMLLLRADWRGGVGTRMVDFVKSPANLPALLFLAVAGASILMAPANAREFGIQEFLRLGSGVVLYFAIAHHVRRSDQLSCLVDVVLFLCCVISIAGFVQFNSGAGKFATGLFGDHQLYGSCLMALLPVAAAVAVCEKKSLARQLFAQSATVLAAAGLLAAHSRSAWIGGASALTVLAVASLVQIVKKQRSNQPVRVHEVAVHAVLLVLTVGFFLYMWPNSASVFGRAATLNAVQADATWNAREATWAGASKMIMQSPVVGHGLGTFPTMAHQYAGIGLPVADLHIRPSLSEQAHNLYLQTASEVGILGLVLFLAIPGTLLFIGARRAMQMDDGIRRTLLIGAMASTVGILVDAIASPSWQMGTVSLFMWLVLGIVASCMQPNTKR